MKNIFTLLCFVSLGLFVTSCGEETCDVLADNVVGTWSIEALGTGSVTLDADGSMTQTENLAFDSTHDGETQSWAVSGGTLTLSSLDGMGGTTSIELVTSTFDCDTINATNGGNNFVLRRI